MIGEYNPSSILVLHFDVAASAVCFLKAQPLKGHKHLAP